jgi:hypothetical protein
MKPVTLSKVEMIENSVRCFYLGLFGLVPFIGLPMAVRSSMLYRKVMRTQREVWNPARRYVFWGGVFARLGLLFLIPWAILILAIIHS